MPPSATAPHERNEKGDDGPAETCRRCGFVVKGGGHSYQGTSNAPDSLLVWTREGLFFVHHGVGIEGWSDDGFTRLARR